MSNLPKSREPEKDINERVKIVRKRAIIFIYKIINDIEISKKIENGCYRFLLDEMSRRNIQINWDNREVISFYSNKLYQIMINIDPESSVNEPYEDINMHDYLYNKIMNNTIDPKELAYMSAYEMNPHINAEYHTNINIRKEQGYKKKTSMAYKCNECGDRNTTIDVAQTRAGDEGQTLFIKCITCSHQWKFYC